MMKNVIEKIKSLIDETTLYYFVIPISIALGISGVYLAILFFEFVLKDLRL